MPASSVILIKKARYFLNHENYIHHPSVPGIGTICQRRYHRNQLRQPWLSRRRGHDGWSIIE